MSEARKKGGIWPWVVAVMIGLPVFYVASFGPVCWISSRTGFGDEVVARMYWPLIQGIFRPSRFDWFYQSLHWYSRLAADRNWGWGTDDFDGHGEIVWGELHRGPPPRIP